MANLLKPYDLTIDENDSNIKTINTGNVSNRKIISMNSSKKKNLGCVTDGDIRRALIKGYNLRHKIKSIMNKNYIYIKNTYTKKNINRILKKYKYKCRIFPILNSEKNILSFIKNEKIPIYKSNLSGKESQYLQDCVNNTVIVSAVNDAKTIAFFILVFCC